MSSACGSCQVESQARACYVTQFTYKLSRKKIQMRILLRASYLTSDNWWISTLSFFLQKTKTLSLALHLRKCRLQCNTVTQGHLGDQIFCKDETLKYVDEFSELKKWRNSKRTQISHSLSTCRSIDALWFSRKDVHIPVSLSFSLYLKLQKRFGSRSDQKGIPERMVPQFKNLCMR